MMMIIVMISVMTTMRMMLMMRSLLRLKHVWKVSWSYACVPADYIAERRCHLGLLVALRFLEHEDNAAMRRARFRPAEDQRPRDL